MADNIRSRIFERERKCKDRERSFFFIFSQFDDELFIRSYLFATSLGEKYRTVTSHFYALSFAEYGNRTKPWENREKNWRNSTALHIFSNIGESINIVEKSIRNMYFLPPTLRKIYIYIHYFFYTPIERNSRKTVQYS